MIYFTRDYFVNNFIEIRNYKLFFRMQTKWKNVYIENTYFAKYEIVIHISIHEQPYINSVFKDSIWK